ncbi:hypothetical protein HYQ46_011695 [Verticillium longisporum]|nr:hypothetical protein HYQ46_011695 [Verticillium longisporum]
MRRTVTLEVADGFMVWRLAVFEGRDLDGVTHGWAGTRSCILAFASRLGCILALLKRILLPCSGRVKRCSR